jgi:hypothetical protein
MLRDSSPRSFEGDEAFVAVKVCDYLGASPANLIWFDTLSEYLVGWQVIAIGNGALPCILVENF